MSVGCFKIVVFLYSKKYMFTILKKLGKKISSKQSIKHVIFYSEFYLNNPTTV